MVCKMFSLKQGALGRTQIQDTGKTVIIKVYTFIWQLYEDTLKTLTNATFIFAAIIFANGRKSLEFFCDIHFCGYSILKNFDTLIIENR